MAKKLFRCSYEVDHEDGKVVVWIEAFSVVKETPCGYWIDLGVPDRRWVSATGRKRFAYPDPCDAVESLVARKRWHVKRARYRLQCVAAALEGAKRLREDPDGRVEIDIDPRGFLEASRTSQAAGCVSSDVEMGGGATRTAWAYRRRVAAWYIREGRLLRRAHREFSDEISRSDNNRVFEAGWSLIAIGRRIAMGYELEAWTNEVYRAHLKATRPAREKEGAHG